MTAQGSGTTDECVMITGASSGIGRETALHLSKLGFRVFGGIRQEQDGESLIEASSGAVEPIYLDVTEPRSIQDASERIRREIEGRGVLRAIVNNAGYPLEAPLEFIDRDSFRHQLEVNVVGLADVTKTFLPLLMRPGGPDHQC